MTTSNTEDLNFSNTKISLDWKSNLNLFACTYPKNFKIIHLNINSIFCKVHFINQILNEQNYDLISIQESKLGPNIPDNFLTSSYYNIIRRDRESGAGGLLIFISKSYQVSDLKIYPNVEAISFSLNLNNLKHHFLTSYNPHYRFKATFLPIIREILESLRTMTSRVLFFGDLNQDLLTLNGDDLFSLMSDFNFFSHLASPTRITATSSTLIDVVFSNSSELISDSKTYGCPFSDHNFVVVALSSNKMHKGAVTFESRMLTNEKLEKINQQLALVPFNTLDSLDDIRDKFYFF